MTKPKTLKYCFHCGRSERDLPLVLLQYAERRLEICPQCLPILIHHPEKLTEKLDRVLNTRP